jgi:thiopeptide-type bacteriocin biosynthesis protein
MKSGASWQSYHVHFPGDAFDRAGDGVLVDTLAPLLDAWRATAAVTKYFFIRYTVDGPHVRLRILPGDVAAACEVEIELVEAARRSGLDVRAAEYVPEMDRYLGPDLLRIGESVFEASSEFALAVIRAGNATDRELRQGKALAAMVIIAHAFLEHRQDALALWDRYSVRYLPRFGLQEDALRRREISEFGQHLLENAPHLVERVGTLLAAVETDASLPEPYETLARRFGVLAKESKRKLRSLESRIAARYPFYVSSHMHMQNNRLGIRPFEETELTNHLSAIYRLLGNGRS